MRYYDFENNKLVYFKKKKIDYRFWDRQWLNNIEEFKKKILNFKPKSLVCKITLKFLNPKNGPILEGGCGLGNKVYNLQRLGYKVIGIDYAKKTIEFLKSNIPEIKVQIGDVRKLSFSDNYFAGYWSLGVIEHFFNGPNGVIDEIKRVIMPNGYIFLTFPYMSPFRQFKTKLNLYKVINKKYNELKGVSRIFYQYVYDVNYIIKIFQDLSFKLKFISPWDGIKGFKDEIFIFKFFFKRFLQLLYVSSKFKLIKRFFDKILSKFSAHMILLVFQKK